MLKVSSKPPLSRQFNDNREVAGSDEERSINNLPPEIIRKILDNLDEPDRSNFGRTNKLFHQITNDYRAEILKKLQEELNAILPVPAKPIPISERDWLNPLPNIPEPEEGWGHSLRNRMDKIIQCQEFFAKAALCYCQTNKARVTQVKTNWPENWWILKCAGKDTPVSIIFSTSVKNSLKEKRTFAQMVYELPNKTKVAFIRLIESSAVPIFVCTISPDGIIYMTDTFGRPISKDQQLRLAENLGFPDEILKEIAKKSLNF